MARRSKWARRTTDRIECVAARVLVAAGVLVALLSGGIGVHVHNQLLDRVRVESAGRVPAVARLLSDALVIGSPYATESTVMVPATWQDRSGSPHTDFVAAPQGLRAGSTVAIWTDPSGAQEPAPTSAGDAEVGGFMAGGSALGVGLGLLFGLWALVRRATLAANCARWEQEWREVAPIWTDGKGTRS